MRISNSNKAVLFLSAVVLLVATSLFGQEKSAAPGTPRIKFAETRHEAGTVNEGAVVVHEFELTNEGDRPLRISELVPA